MANIETYLQKILDAIYGEEVRGSIHDALEAMNTESSSAMSIASTAQDSAKASAAQAQQSAESAKNYSGKPPIIGSDGNWETWNESSKAYQTTGKPSRGEQGPQGPKGDAGSGSGDMLASVYDTKGKNTDIFQYVDGLVGNIKTVLEAINGEASA